MNDNLRFPSGKTVKQIKKDAKRLSKLSDIPLNEVLDQLAEENGFSVPWHEAIIHLSSTSDIDLSMYYKLACKYQQRMKKHKYGQGYIGTIISPLFVLAGRNDMALDYERWVNKAFPGSSSDAFQSYYTAIALHRLGREAEAVKMLLCSYSTNIFLLWYIIDTLHPLSVEIDGLWYGSNNRTLEILDLYPKMVHPECSHEESDWLIGHLESDAFVELRDMYINHHRRLNTLHGCDVRRKECAAWEAYLNMKNIPRKFD